MLVALESNHLIISTNQKKGPKNASLLHFSRLFFFVPWLSFFEKQERTNPVRPSRCVRKAQVHETPAREREKNKKKFVHRASDICTSEEEEGAVCAEGEAGTFSDGDDDDDVEVAGSANNQTPPYK